MKTIRIAVACVAGAVLIFGALLFLARAPEAAEPDRGTPLPVEPTTLPIEVDRERRELVLEYGAVDLPAGASHTEVQQLGPLVGTIPFDGWLRGYRVELVDAEGKPVPQVVLHHINIIGTDRRELFSEIMQRLGAAGHETAPVKLPRLFGVPVHEGERLLVTAMLHNPTSESYKGVRVVTRMLYTPRDTWLRPISVFPFYLDVMPPASKHAYDLPPGRSEKSWEGRPAVSGRILGVGGHLHKYAVALRFEDVTAGKVLWEATPEVDEDGNVIGMPTRLFLGRFGIPLRTDHVYRLTAIYDNPTGETLPDAAMGTLGGIVAPSRDTKWPGVDRRHPDYLLDWDLLRDASYGSPDAGGHHHHH
ncbi:MAG TPA: hypothetical protein VIL18_13685 [Longimicrobiales bacterium]